MFTKQELNILQAALRNWTGPYGPGKLSVAEGQFLKKELNCAINLADRFSEILGNYREMENSHLP